MGVAYQQLGTVPVQPIGRTLEALAECGSGCVEGKKEGEVIRPQALPVLPDRLPITGVTSERVSKFVLGVTAVATDPMEGDLMKL